MARFRAVLDTKYGGLNNILSCVDKEKLKLVVSFSSVAGYFGNDGQMDYAAGNEFLAKFSHYFRRKYPTCKALTINWGAWDGGMMDYIYRKTLTEKGYVLIPLDVGAGYFANEFAWSQLLRIRECRNRSHQCALSAQGWRPGSSGARGITRF